jgi:integrase
MSNDEKKQRLERFTTKYPGVFYRIVKRIGRNDTEKVFYAVFKLGGRTIETKLGRQYVDDMTPAKANFLRGELIEGRETTRAQKRADKKKLPITLSDIWNEYRRINVSNKSLKADDNRFNLHIKAPFGDRQLCDISIREIDNFNLSLSESSPKTVKNTLELLTRLSNFSIRKQIGAGLSFKIEYPVVNNEKTEDLSEDQVKNLLNVLNSSENLDVKNIMFLALYSGMRRGEIFKLKWSDIDLERKIVYLRNPKSGRDKVLPLNDLALNILKDCTHHEGEYIFPARSGGPRKSISRAAQEIMKAAGIPDDFRPMHGLRHFFATNLICNGVDLAVLQKLMTHSSPQMTLRYAKIRDKVLADASNKMTEIMLRK